MNSNPNFFLWGCDNFSICHLNIFVLIKEMRDSLVRQKKNRIIFIGRTEKDLALIKINCS